MKCPGPCIASPTPCLKTREACWQNRVRHTAFLITRQQKGKQGVLDNSFGFIFFFQIVLVAI